MNKSLKIYRIDSNYLNYLKSFDKHVNTNSPYIGTINIGGYNYYVPISKFKNKYGKINSKRIDVFMLDNGSLGVANLNNMIPVPNEYVKDILNDDLNEKYKYLIQNQLTFLNDNKTKFINKAKLFKNKYTEGFFPINIENRSCNFNILEKKSNKHH